MATEKDPLGNDLRKRRRRRRLPPNATCSRCGEDRLVTLLLDHPAGDANAPEPVRVLCRNCDAVFTEAQRDVGADLSHRPDRTPTEMVEGGLRLYSRSLSVASEVIDTIAPEPAGFQVVEPICST